MAPKQHPTLSSATDAGRGRYVALEGTEGVGKTTLNQLLGERLIHRGVEVVRVREPGGTPLGEQIRRMLLHGYDMADWTEALLFAAQRSELISKVVAPALTRGLWVLSDRGFYSSLAYQGHARGLGIDPVRSVNAAAMGHTLPDVVVWLDADVEVGLSRQQEPDRIGSSDVSLHQKVREGYRYLWASGEHNLLKVDATATPSHTADMLMRHFERIQWIPPSDGRHQERA